MLQFLQHVYTHTQTHRQTHMYIIAYQCSSFPVKRVFTALCTSIVNLFLQVSFETTGKESKYLLVGAQFSPFVSNRRKKGNANITQETEKYKYVKSTARR